MFWRLLHFKVITFFGFVPRHTLLCSKSPYFFISTTSACRNGAGILATLNWMPLEIERNELNEWHRAHQWKVLRMHFFSAFYWRITLAFFCSMWLQVLVWKTSWCLYWLHLSGPHDPCSSGKLESCVFQMSH